MKNLSVLVFSITCIVFSAFSTASATDLKSAWLEYENARNLLIESYVQIDDSWEIVKSTWSDYIYDSVQQVLSAYSEANRAWDEVAAAEAIANSTLKTTLDASSNRGHCCLVPPRLILSQRNSTTLPWTPEPTWGSAEELSKAWTNLDKAWAEANNAWAELDGVWEYTASANEILVDYWGKTDAQWAKINAAWAAIDAAWAAKK